MSLEQSLQVSTATLRAANTRQHYTDRVSGVTYHPIYLPSPEEREGGEGAKALNRHEWHSKQTACSHTAGKRNA